jgi:hypothetical protein
LLSLSVFYELFFQKIKKLNKTGLSDGINVEVLYGLKKTDNIKVPK